MPIYVYAHDDDGDCPTFETFQRMADDRLEVCPTCGGSVHRVLQPLRAAVKKSSPVDAGRVMRKYYGLQYGEKCYQVPESGEVVMLNGPKSTWKQKVADAHTRANDPTTAQDVDFDV
jgi:putative FmdB family regulatory protein